MGGHIRSQLLMNPESKIDMINYLQYHRVSTTVGRFCTFEANLLFLYI